MAKMGMVSWHVHKDVNHDEDR